MIILSLDQSLTRTGYAAMTEKFKPEDIVTGSFASADPADFIARTFILINELKPGFLIWEQPVNVIFQYGKKQLVEGKGMVTPNADQLKLHQLHGGLLALAHVLGLGYLAVAPKSWRARVLGDGNMTRAKAKAAAVTHCARLGVAQRNHDRAEAVCIGLYGLSSTEVRYRLSIKDGSK